MLSSLRLECKQKNFSNSFLSYTHLELKYVHTLRSSLPKWAKCITVFSPKQCKNPTRWGGTYLYGLKREFPLPSGGNLRPLRPEKIHLSFLFCFVFVVQFIGLFNAADDVNIEWVIVKVISHFSNDGNAPSESWKSFASIMAASLVSNMLSDPIVFKEWPHYEGM